MHGRSDGGVVLGSMHFVEYDDAHFVGGISSDHVVLKLYRSENAAVESKWSYPPMYVNVGHAVECAEGSCQ